MLTGLLCNDTPGGPHFQLQLDMKALSLMTSLAMAVTYL